MRWCDHHHVEVEKDCPQCRVENKAAESLKESQSRAAPNPSKKSWLITVLGVLGFILWWYFLLFNPFSSFEKKSHVPADVTKSTSGNISDSSAGGLTTTGFKNSGVEPTTPPKEEREETGGNRTISPPVTGSAPVPVHDGVDSHKETFTKTESPNHPIDGIPVLRAEPVEVKKAIPIEPSPRAIDDIPVLKAEPVEVKKAIPLEPNGSSDSSKPISAGEWVNDYKGALATAANENKKILLNFTSSDWRGWCKRLKNETFDQVAFREYAAKKLVLVEVDFHQAQSPSTAVMMQNVSLQQQYQVKVFPTLVLLSPDGNVIKKQSGYIPGGPDGFIRWAESATSQHPAISPTLPVIEQVSPLPSNTPVDPIIAKPTQFSKPAPITLPVTKTSVITESRNNRGKAYPDVVNGVRFYHPKDRFPSDIAGILMVGDFVVMGEYEDGGMEICAAEDANSLFPKAVRSYILRNMTSGLPPDNYFDDDKQPKISFTKSHPLRLIGKLHPARYEVEAVR